MNKKLILTSVFALGFVCPALAITEVPLANFPEDGLLEKDTRYIDAATEAHLAGVYEDNATIYAIAQFADKISCPTQYPNSDSDFVFGTFQCYRSCNASDFAHAESVAGRDYYGSSSDTCQITACVAGWHVVKNGVDGSELLAMVGNGNGTNSAVASYNNVLEYYGNLDSAYYTNQSDPVFVGNVNDEWAAEVNNIMLRGTSKIVDKACFCNINGYRQTGHWYTLSSPWAMLSDVGYQNQPDECAKVCAGHMRESQYYEFRSRLLNSAVASTACEANRINVVWGDTLSADVATNNAGVITYGGDINTPVKINPESVPVGKRFAGWVFSDKPAEN